MELLDQNFNSIFRKDHEKMSYELVEAMSQNRQKKEFGHKGLMGGRLFSVDFQYIT